MTKGIRQRTITINQGEEYKIRLGCVYEPNSLFYDSYQDGAKLLAETLQIADKVREQDGAQANSLMSTENDNSYEFSNNIIAFCGGRGDGKSSAMRTFAHALENIGDERNRSSCETVTGFWAMPMGKYAFEVLPVIDPTMMREQDSFIRVILSRMFVQLRNRYDDNFVNVENSYLSGRNTRGNRMSNDQLENIMTRFRDCYTCLDTLSKKPDIDDRYDDLEEIADLGDSANLKYKFRQLVKVYLEVMNAGVATDLSHHYLVLQIDDADLNIRHEYEVLEDIRTYCVVPEVVILMAANMEQLQQVIEQHYIADFELMLKYSGKARGEGIPAFLKSCRQMAMRYIDKLIPGSRQVHLPQIDALLKDEAVNLSVSYMTMRNDGKGRSGRDMLESAKGIAEDYQEYLLGCLYRKAGIALVKPRAYRHNLLPQHLRELTHSLAFFGKMEDLNTGYNIARIHSLLLEPDAGLHGKWKEKYREALKAKELWVGNLQGLEQYFLKSWAVMHLGRDGQEAIEGIANTADTMKAQVICAFCDTYADKLNVTLPAFPGTVYSEYSYAYVMTKLDNLSSVVQQEEDYCFVYALRFYYMLHIYKKLLALTGDEEGYRRLIQDVKLESWVMDYARSEAPYSYRRFEVDLSALTLLRTEFSHTSIEDKLQAQIGDILYMITPAHTGRYIQTQDIPELLNSHADRKPDQGHVMFDWSFFLISQALGNRGNYSVPSDDTDKDVNEWETRVDTLYVALQLLFNWDVQHELKHNLRSESSRGINSETTDSAVLLSDWVEVYWHTLVESVQSLKYICWMVNPSAFSTNLGSVVMAMKQEGFDVLCYGNYEFAKHLLVDFCEELKTTLEICEDEESDLRSRIRALNDFKNAITMRRYDLEGCSILSGVSDLYNESNRIWAETPERDGVRRTISAEQMTARLENCRAWVKLLKENANLTVLDDIFGRTNTTESDNAGITIE